MRFEIVASLPLLGLLLVAMCLLASVPRGPHVSVQQACITACGQVEEAEQEAHRWNQRWLYLLRQVVLGLSLPTLEYSIVPPGPREGEDVRLFYQPLHREKRKKGEDWPVFGLTMVGEMRLDNVRFLVEQAVREGVAGDWLEAGVWRGGTSIYVKGILEALGQGADRWIWVADSGTGVPKPRNGAKHRDLRVVWNDLAYLRVPRELVKENFRALGLLDDRVQFCYGEFVDTMPLCAKDRKLAIIRIDGDLYESTADVLWNVYPRLSIGGYLLLDDFHFEEVQRAVKEFYAHHNLTLEVHHVGDGNGAYVVKRQEAEVDFLYYKQQIQFYTMPLLPFLLLVVSLALAQLHDWRLIDDNGSECKCPDGSQGISEFAHARRCNTLNARLSYGEQIVHACNPEPFVQLASNPPQERCLVCWPTVTSPPQQQQQQEKKEEEETAAPKASHQKRKRQDKAAESQ